MGTIATLKNADFVVHFGSDYDEDPYGDGTPGFGGTFEVDRKAYAKLYAEHEFALYSFDGLDEDDEDEEILEIPIGDDFIVWANAASIEGGKWEVTYNGNPYWFFHDLIHAQYDCSGGNVEIDRYGDAENRALFMGAEMAYDHDVRLNVILKELARTLKPFEERFGHETTALDRFADFLAERHLDVAESNP